jgi:1-acyl-sn-glycerol-3-phosphate acyltransferase
VLKKSLLRIPFFGWGLALMHPIAIDRSKPREALKLIQREGQSRLEEGLNVLVFPEGTRTASGQTGNYQKGGAGIACSAGVPVVPVALNSGVYWPVPGFIKHPGTIQVKIGAPIDTQGRNPKEITEEVRTWIEARVAEMPDSV